MIPALIEQDGYVVDNNMGKGYNFMAQERTGTC